MFVALGYIRQTDLTGPSVRASKHFPSGDRKLMYGKVVIETKEAPDAWQNVSEHGHVDAVAGKVGNRL